jgi:large subunit ribosomal protein L35
LRKIEDDDEHEDESRLRILGIIEDECDIRSKRKRQNSETFRLQFQARVFLCGIVEDRNDWTDGTEALPPISKKKFRLPIHIPEIHSGLPMPKPIARRKTKKAVAKRFKVTATGKVLRSHAGRRHLLQSKSAKRKRQLAKREVTDRSDEVRIKENLPFN